MAKFKKKPKKLTKRQEIEEKRLAEHERIVNELAKTEPGTEKYDALQRELHQFDSIDNDKDRIKITDKNSKREHLGKTLISGGVTALLGAVALSKDAVSPMTSKLGQNFFNKILK